MPNSSCPIWDPTKYDWSECFRVRIFNTLLPLLIILTSLLVIVVSAVRRASRRATSAIDVAKLDPSASSFVPPQPPANGSSVAGPSKTSWLARLAAKLLPWNAPRLIPSLAAESSAPDTAAAAQSRNGKSPAALIVHFAENSVILNEVLTTPASNLTRSQKRRTRRLEFTKRIIEVVLGISLAATHCAAWMLREKRDRSDWQLCWVAAWIYFSLLSAYTLTSSTSFFTHKSLILIVYFVVAISNLRSAVLSSGQSAPIGLSVLQLVLSCLVLIPTLFFPLHSRLPARLRAIHSTMRAEKRHGEARTAYPTPHRPGARSIASDDDEEDDEASPAIQQVDVSDLDVKPPPVPSPETSASLYSRMLFGFITPAMIKHYKVPFTIDTVPELPPADKAAAVVASFRSAQGQFSAASVAAVASAASGTSDAPARLPASNRSLPFRLAIFFASFLTYQFVFAFLQAILTLAPAVGMRYILAFIAQRDRHRRGIDDGEPMTPVHMAILYAAGMAIGQILSSICASQALFVGRRICINLRAILITEIMTKILRRRDGSGGTKKKVPEEGEGATDGAATPSDDKEDAGATDGQIVNLISVDVFKVSEICAYLHFIFPQCPVQIAVCLYLLWTLLGWSSLVGFGILALSLPVQTLTANLFVTLQERLLKATDERLNLATEVLQNVKVIKFCSWERLFLKKMNETREAELKVLMYRYLAYLINTLTFVAVPMAVTVCTFAFHVKVAHKPLDAETAFTSLSIFSLIRAPLDQLPDLIVNVLSSLVSVRRIDKFLHEEDTGKYEQLLKPEDEGVDGATAGDDNPLVGFQDASFTFASSLDDPSAFALRELNLSFPDGKLSLIAGPVGSGKTTLLLSLLGETHRLSGRTFFPCAVSRALVPVDPATGLADTVAYCAQSAWLLGTTVRENILFGSKYDERRYKTVLRACALEQDLKVLEYNDLTEVGEKGTALSGGQKARVALARALYSTARFLLIDDALAAVDAHTAEHLFKNYLTGPLAVGRTIVLVTHSVSLCLSGAAFVVAMEEGRVVASGSPEAVKASGVFGDEGKSGKEESVKADADEEAAAPNAPESTIEELDEGARAAEQAEIRKQQDKKAAMANDETWAQGSVGGKTYGMYLSSLSDNVLLAGLFWSLLLLVFIVLRATDVSATAWLRKWASTYDGAPRHVDATVLGNSSYVWPSMASSMVGAGVEPGRMAAFAGAGLTSALTGMQKSDTVLHRAIESLHIPVAKAQQVFFGLDVETSTSASAGALAEHDDSTYYLTVYMSIMIAFVVLSLVRDTGLAYGSILSSRRLYKRMLTAILSASPTWFDKTPVGRIMNRLSKDIETVDQELAPQLMWFLDMTLQSATILIVIVYGVPQFAWLSFIVIGTYTAIGVLYLVSSRDLKRIESVQRSPIYTLVGEVIIGAVAIRAYGDCGRFVRHALRLVDKSSAPFFALWYENRWLSLRIDIVAAFIAFAASMFLIATPSVDAALAGFTLSYSIMLVDSVLWVVRLYTMCEISMNSVERIAEYTSITPEPAGGVEPPAYWPSDQGSIVIEDLAVRYTPEFPRVLDGVTLTIEAGQKVGICGRTGSGKSTLTLALFRFLAAEEGRIIIDGIDISTVPLETLRSRLTVIPQESQLFSGTVRFNLDPFDLYEDRDLWAVLENCRLAATGRTPGASRAPSRPPSPPHGEGEGNATGSEDGTLAETERAIITSLDMNIEQGGKNLSAGQKQLLALSRGLLKLRDSRILVLDESTASLDAASDALVQKTIRSELGSATLLVVAHRLRTIADFDKIIVLDRGKLVEFDTPANLLRKEGGAFQTLAQRSGEWDVLEDMAFTRERQIELEKRTSHHSK